MFCSIPDSSNRELAGLWICKCDGGVFSEPRRTTLTIIQGLYCKEASTGPGASCGTGRTPKPDKKLPVPPCKSSPGGEACCLYFVATVRLRENTIPGRHNRSTLPDTILNFLPISHQTFGSWRPQRWEVRREEIRPSECVAPLISPLLHIPRPLERFTFTP